MLRVEVSCLHLWRGHCPIYTVYKGSMKSKFLQHLVLLPAVEPHQHSALTELEQLSSCDAAAQL